MSLPENPSHARLENGQFNLKSRNKFVLPIRSSARQVLEAGSLIYDDLSSSTPKLYYSDGASWNEVGGGVEVVPTLPAPGSPEGTLVYTQDTQLLYYSDGAVWIQVGAVVPEVVPTLPAPGSPEGTLVYTQDTQFLYYSDGAAWIQLQTGSDTWADVLANGNTTNGNNPTISAGDLLDISNIGEIEAVASNLVIRVQSPSNKLILEALGDVRSLGDIDMAQNLRSTGSGPSLGGAGTPGTLTTGSTNVAGIVSGWDPSTGDLVVTFSPSLPAGQLPVVTLTATVSGPASTDLVVIAADNTGFTVKIVTALTSIGFNYHVIIIEM